MKNIFYTLAFVFVSGFMLKAQAILPTSWSFTNTNLPTGWTQLGTLFYSASGNTPPAMKFDGTGDYLEINIASNPGAVTYYLAGNIATGSSFTGTFTVEESIDGNTWTTLHTHTAPTIGSYTQYTDNPLASTRFIRFIFTNKQSGNIGLDDVSIAIGAATPEQEINVKQGTTTVLTGGTQYISSPVSTMTPFTFTIENLGTTNDLTISNVTISGPDASDFTVVSSPTSIAGLSSDQLTINFSPSSAGTRTAVLLISNNDADEATYAINLYGIGGSYASEPASQPTNLTFSNIKTYRFSGSYSPTNAEGYLVLRKKGSPITDVPTDGTIYERGDNIGESQVVFSANSTSFTPNHIVASATYYFAVFAYNGDGTYRNYLTTAPLTANVTTPATMMPSNYYTGISTASNTFVADLHAKVNPHDMLYYSDYTNTMVRLFAARDTTMNRRVITCVYSGENKIYTEPFDFTANGYSREHTFCHNWMPTNPADALPEYNDYHHLFPTNQNDVNAVRSNYPLGKVVTVTSSYMGSKYGTDANGHKVFEPRDEHKGDAARAMMYESICYTTVSGNTWNFPTNISSSIPYGQDQYILKQWHFQDPPDGWEIARNDFIDSLQGNRNPFIDSVDYACYVNFSNMTYETLACEASVEEMLNNGFIVYPNPAKGILSLHVDATTINRYEILDNQGRIILSSDVNNQVLVKVNIDSLKPGSYILRAKTPYGIAQKSVIIQ